MRKLFQRWGKQRRATQVAETLTELTSPGAPRTEILSLISQNRDVLGVPVRIAGSPSTTNIVLHLIDLSLQYKMQQWSLSELVLMWQQIDCIEEYYPYALDVTRASDFELLQRCVLYVFVASFEQQKPQEFEPWAQWLAEAELLKEALPDQWHLTPYVEKIMVDSFKPLCRILLDEKHSDRLRMIHFCQSHLSTLFAISKARMYVVGAIRKLPPKARSRAEILATVDLLIDLAELNAEDDRGRLANVGQVLTALDAVVKDCLSASAEEAAQKRLLPFMPGQAT